ncbi:MAG: M81 family metallopeptidase [Gammaproteobacteria bacterium]|nr:M81 family metallopeptidase [Gammaproteobacteria bacterium]MYJ51451.1 M81 family metallopeptidase [Gammaproteobacteria bacterium]
MAMSRIAVGGWQHETNTFATLRADYQAFAMADEWPAKQSGQAMLDTVAGVHLPITGAIRALKERKDEIVPLLWCSATPCSYVTKDAFERIASEMLQLLEQALPVDGIYLDLHGAMVCEHIDDGDGEILSRVRRLVGDGMPIFVSLDLHANITPRMVQSATVIDVFRTYPHVDMGETGHRAAMYLSRYLENPAPLFKHYRQIDFIIPLNTGCTLLEPCRSIYRVLPDHISDSVPSVSLACGFHLSDIFDAGPAVVAYGYEPDDVQAAAEALVREVYGHKQAFHDKVWPVDQGIAEARKAFDAHGRTIVIADTQDNPGGGGSGDTVGVLRSMLEHRLDNAVFGVMNDREVAATAHSRGVGAELEIELGCKESAAGGALLKCRAVVTALSDGNFTATGPMYRGARMEIGKTAVLQVEGVRIVVCSKAVQTADKEHFRHVGIEPGKMDYVAVKSSVHFRNDYQDIASRILVVAAPGEVHADPALLDYRFIRSGIERTALG